jgi:predicted Zn-dependent protease
VNEKQIITVLSNRSRNFFFCDVVTFSELDISSKSKTVLKSFRDLKKSSYLMLRGRRRNSLKPLYLDP